jgi:hypothetical protein
MECKPPYCELVECKPPYCVLVECTPPYCVLVECTPPYCVLEECKPVYCLLVVFLEGENSPGIYPAKYSVTGGIERGWGSGEVGGRR